MPEEPYEWDPDVPLSGVLNVYWSVTVDADGQLTGFVSPYQLMPTGGEDDEFRGTELGLNQPLRSHPNHEMAAAAMMFTDIAVRQWFKPTLQARLYRALIEQRDRQGGYEAGLKDLDEDQQNEGYDA